MATTTITLDRAAYELLKSKKRPEESFSEEVRRLLAGSQPSLRGFLAIFPPEEGEDLAKAIETVRREDLDVELGRRGARRRGHGHRA